MTTARGTVEHGPGRRPPLTDAEVERYARQIVIPGLGASGQARLLESSILVTGDPLAATLARRYASAAGARVTEQCAGADCIVLAGCEGIEAAVLENVVRAGAPVVWYRMAADGFTSGVACGGDEVRSACRRAEPAPRALALDHARALHAAAACDAVARAIGVLLGWPQALFPAEARLA